MIKLFPAVEKAYLIERLNRFTLLVSDRNERALKAYLPNSGSLEELLIPGRTVLVIDNRGGTLPLRAVGVVDEEDNPIMIDSIKVNDLLPLIINKVSSLRGYTISKREVKYENARFDFLLERGEEKLLLEVKGCTLFSGNIASFPDAPTKRGVKHLRILSKLPEEVKGGILFLIQRPVKYFVPNFHNDLEFAKELFKAKDRILVEAVSLKWDEDLNLLEDSIRRVEIPWSTIEPFLEDRGAYIILLFNQEDKEISFSRGLKDKAMLFRRGFYTYIGSALRGLSSRVRRHLNQTNKAFWHIDYIKGDMKILKTFTIRSPRKIECEIAKELKEIADDYIPNFGSSDCKCESHLLYFNEDPRKRGDFFKILLKFRFENIIEDC